MPVSKVQNLDDVRARPSGSDTCEIGLDQNRRGNGIHLWNCERAVITGNHVRDARDGIYFSFANRSVIRGNDIARVRFGLHYMYSDGNVFENNRFAENAAGSTLMFSRNMVIRGNTFTANTGHRAYGMVFTQVDTSRIERNEFSGNSISLCVEYSNQNTFVGNTFARSYIGPGSPADQTTTASRETSSLPIFTRSRSTVISPTTSGVISRVATAGETPPRSTSTATA